VGAEEEKEIKRNEWEQKKKKEMKRNEWE